MFHKKKLPGVIFSLKQHLFDQQCKRFSTQGETVFKTFFLPVCRGEKAVQYMSKSAWGSGKKIGWQSVYCKKWTHF